MHDKNMNDTSNAPEDKPSRMSRLIPRPNILNGDVDDILHEHDEEIRTLCETKLDNMPALHLDKE